MRERTAQLEANSTIAMDPRRELVERIIGSPSFIKSPRLCSFLRYICDLTLEGRTEEINEVNIGKKLFGRAPNYDPSIDGIVRSHASRLRQRLDQYFGEEGAHETLRLFIPKGGYTPIFESQPEEPARPELPLFNDPPAPVALSEPAISEQPPQRIFWLLWVLVIALAMACASNVYLLLHSSRSTQPVTALKHPLWGRMFGQDRHTMIVASDTGLTGLETLTGRNVKLADYLSGDYRTHAQAVAGISPALVQLLAARRYTSIVDLDIVTKFYQIPGIPMNRLQIAYARDVRPNDLKNGPVIFLGALEGTPWIELFQDRMNFAFTHDRQNRTFVVLNRSPQGNELSRYESDPGDPTHKIYGMLALRPNLAGSGQILIIEGTSMAGTESAADFVFDDARLLPFLNKIKKPDGSLPYFELLLQSSNMNGNASQSQILAYRTSSI
jgi:hypothetical protein